MIRRLNVMKSERTLTLLHSAIIYFLSVPGVSTGGKGEPVAMSALPLLHWLASFGLAVDQYGEIPAIVESHSTSQSRVGLLSCATSQHRCVQLRKIRTGKMIGLSTCFDISLTTSSVKAPPCVLVPMSTVGLTLFTTSSSPICPSFQSSS